MSRALVGVMLISFVGCGDDRLNGFGNEQGTHEDPAGCLTSLDCPENSVCVDSACVPVCINPPCDEVPIDPDPTDPLPLYVGGAWLTQYHFDWSDYLGPLAGLGSEIDYLDQLLMGNSTITGLPLIDSIIMQIIDQYIPDWVQELVHILNNIVHFFEDVRIEARMTLAHVSGSPRDLTGTEIWDWGYVQIIDNCPLGEQDPNYPSCAEVAVPLNSWVASFGVIGAEALPFTGELVGDDIVFTHRVVRMQMSQFVLYVLDLITRIATNNQYNTFEAALVAIVDCNGLANSLSNTLCSSFGMCSMGPVIYAACVDVRDDVIDEVITALTDITVEWEAMQFDQRAHVYDNPVDGNADELGHAQDPGLIENGQFEFLLSADLTGTWTGRRP
ncbi:MAG: hypothetical protein HYZ27_07715 [Deltaproteobacteria bacterium]|nr:hypothetical protein [Deltaproteobacteria bacterium]